MKQQLRIDFSGSLPIAGFEPPRAKRTADGYLLIEGAVIARGGVLTYHNADGTERHELRDPEVMHTDEALAKWRKIPVGYGHHPTTWDGRAIDITPDNVRSFMVGVIGDRVWAEKVGDAQIPVTRADVILHDVDAIGCAVHDFMREWSVGYWAYVDNTPGEWEGQRYDARQISEEPNHLVLCEMGRAGRVTRFEVDSAGALRGDAHPLPNTPKPLPSHPSPQQPDHTGGTPMPKVTMHVDGVPVEVEEATAPLIQKLVGDRDAAIKAKESAETARDTALQLAEKAKAEAEAARLTPDQIDALAQERADLVSSVRAVCGDTYDAKGKDATTLHTDALQALGLDVPSTPEHIAVAYSTAMQHRSKGQAEANAQRGDGKPRGASRVDSARDKFLAAQRWVPFSQRGATAAD